MIIQSIGPPARVSFILDIRFYRGCGAQERGRGEVQLLRLWCGRQFRGFERNLHAALACIPEAPCLRAARHGRSPSNTNPRPHAMRRRSRVAQRSGRRNAGDPDTVPGSPPVPSPADLVNDTSFIIRYDDSSTPACRARATGCPAGIGRGFARVARRRRQPAWAKVSA